MTPDQLEWLGNLLTNQGVAVVALLSVFAFIGFMFWPWFTKQYEAGKAREEKVQLEFAATIKNFNETISRRDDLRYQEHTQYMQTISQISTSFLQAQSDQRDAFTKSLNDLRVSQDQQLVRRDDAVTNIVQALDDLAEQVAEFRHEKRSGN